MIITLSSKFQFVIPKAMREKLKLKPGMKFAVMEEQGQIILVPVPTAKSLRGFLKGKLKDSNVYREKEDRDI